MKLSNISRSISNKISRNISHKIHEVPARLISGSSVSAAFTTSTTSPVAGQDVTFTNTSTGAVSYSWDFGDGTVPSTSTSPTHYFVGLGPYTVTLTATDDQGNISTATATISPTAPTTSYTLVNRQDFTADVTNAISVPGGAKLAATSGIGWSGMTATNITQSNFNTCTAGAEIAPMSDQLPRLFGAWYRFESSAGNAILAGALQYVAYKAGWRIAGGNLIANGSVVMSVPIGRWIWLGFSIGYVSPSSLATRSVYRYADDPTLVTAASGNVAFDSSTTYGIVGGWSLAGNAGAIGRISMASHHILSSINDPGYPGDLVPPQVDNYIYRVDPVGGNDANDGVTGAWKTITRVNRMLKGNAFDGYPWQSIVSTPASASPGSGAVLEIDTSADQLDVGTTGLRVYTPGIHVKAKSGNTWIDYKPYVDISSWTVTGGHANTYQVACTFSNTRLFCKTDAELYKKVANLTALDAETDKAFCWVSNVLYIKSATDPRSNGKSYLYTRIRQGSVGDPVVCVGSYAIKISDSKIWYTAYDNNGSYCIGDLQGFSGQCTVDHFDVRYTDKHSICWTANATNSTIITTNGVSEQGLSQPLTSFMNTGSGNTHIWSNITCEKDLLRENLPAGDYGFGAFYSHGGGTNRYDLIWIDTCDFGLCDVSIEVPANLFKISDSTCGRVSSQCVLLIDNSTIDLLGESYSQGITTDLTITDTTIRSSGGTGLLYGLVTSNIIAMTGNTYYATAAQQIVKNFNGSNNYTFAQWQALGYDVGSIRIDP